MTRRLSLALVAFTTGCCALNAQQSSDYLAVIKAAKARVVAHHGKATPTLSPGYEAIADGTVPVDQLHALGFKVLGGTSHDEAVLRTMLQRHVDGMITDRPDIMQRLLAEAAASAKSPAEKTYLAGFDVQAHRGGRGLRPENTLPSFENGIDIGATTLELDTGVTTDHVSMIWHDEYFLPKACRRTDGKPYEKKADRVFLHDLSSTDAQRIFICDKIYFEDHQQNDLALSPVSVAFAKQEGLANPYTPLRLEQLFRFVRFYRDYYSAGPGKGQPDAGKRVRNAERIRFDIETKLIPDFIPNKQTGKLERSENNTAEPQAFVDAIMKAVRENKMESRIEIQSFDFRTLRLVEEQFPNIPTYYITGNKSLYPSQWLAAEK